jgi:hypothetical protein
MMLTTLEELACEDHIERLVIVAGDGVPVAAFEHHGFTALASDSSGAWREKRLDGSAVVAAPYHASYL